MTKTIQHYITLSETRHFDVLLARQAAKFWVERSDKYLDYIDP